MGSACSGGFDVPLIAVKNLDSDLVAAFACEVGKKERKLLRHNHPDLRKIYNDVFNDFSKAPGADVFTGGFPCGPYSTAGIPKTTPQRDPNLVEERTLTIQNKIN